MLEDVDPAETREWVDALDSVLTFEGADRASFLLDEVISEARRKGAPVSYGVTTQYLNTIPPSKEDRLGPRELALDRRIRSLIRWNAMAMVLRANAESTELGGHIASFQSMATLYEVGFQHFFHAPTDHHGGDLVFFQGHSSPGIYARSFVEGRLTEDQLTKFRMETGGGGLSSYPHPWLMPDYWQMPTVSMGLGPIMAIYQARFLKYLACRGLADSADRKVWAFLGDGETDEPESLGAIALASRERLDNLIFVINCNLQRLDGPVRGNGKIIQELEGIFRGAGWNVIKVIWGSGWDPLIARDSSGLLLKRMEECVDGEYQDFKSKNGAYVREKFFGKYPELAEMVAGMTDDEVWKLNRGGHDPDKVYAAYSAAVRIVGQPTVILAKTIKGYGMGESGEGQNITHQQKHMADVALRQFRDRFDVPVTDEQLAELPFLRFDEDSEEMAYLRERRAALGGFLPARRRRSSQTLPVPELSAFGAQLGGTPGRQISTTMAFVRILNTLLRDKKIGRHVVPIVPDESRTFGMEGMFRQFGIFSQVGQLYQPEDANQLMYYREAPDGQMLQEGITEEGAMASWIAAATGYSTSDVPMIPFYIFYSMFGFQRFMDLAWAAGDARARGFLLGATSGRTTLNGEGLQHEDGHSHVLASVIPSCVAYDPAFGYEVAVIVHDGLRRMLAEQEDVYFYITLMNENYEHPAMPEGAEAGIIKGLYVLHEASPAAGGPAVQLLGSGTILREVLAGADLLAADYGVAADVWSATSFTELRRDGLAAERWNMLHPAEPLRRSYVEECLSGRPGPVIAATDYVRSFADQIRPFVPRRYRVLGTDGYGRSDYRRNLRRFFEVDRHYVAVAALKSLAEEGTVPSATVADAISRYGIDAGRTRPGHEKTGHEKRGKERRDRHRRPRGAMPKVTEVKVPDLGDFADVPVIEIHVKAGDVVNEEDPLITLESDKASMDVPSPAAGRVDELRVKLGDLVSAGSPVLLLDTEGALTEPPSLADQQEPPGQEAPEPVAAMQEPARRSAGTAQLAPARPAAAPPADFGAAHAGPGVRRLARELGVDLATVTGTGPKGRITKEDLLAIVRGPGAGPGVPRPAVPAAAGIPAIPAQDFSKFGPVEVRPLSRIQRISGRQLHRSWLNVPHVTHNDEADITELDALRRELDTAARAEGYRVTLLAFLMKVSVSALREFPRFNSSLTPENDALVYKGYYHIGVAVDTADGLVVPVIRDVDRKGVNELSRELSAVSARAREGKLGMDEIQGACFTITSLGGIGGTAFTPIVNAPEVAILGVVRSRTAPVWDGTAFVPRLLLPLSLSYDHRVIDGALAARFVRYVCHLLEDIRRLVL